MDTILNTVGDLLPYHILSYGTLLGSQLFQVSKERMQPRASHGISSHDCYESELCQHQGLLPGAPNARIPSFAKEDFPSLFRESNRACNFDGGHAPTLQPSLPGQRHPGDNISRCCRRYGLVELLHVWASHNDGRVCEAPSSRYAMPLRHQ